MDFKIFFLLTYFWFIFEFEYNQNFLFLWLFVKHKLVVYIAGLTFCD